MRSHMLRELRDVSDRCVKLILMIEEIRLRISCFFPKRNVLTFARILAAGYSADNKLIIPYCSRVWMRRTVAGETKAVSMPTYVCTYVSMWCACDLAYNDSDNGWVVKVARTRDDASEAFVARLVLGECTVRERVYLFSFYVSILANPSFVLSHTCLFFVALIRASGATHSSRFLILYISNKIEARKRIAGKCIVEINLARELSFNRWLNSLSLILLFYTYGTLLPSSLLSCIKYIVYQLCDLFWVWKLNVPEHLISSLPPPLSIYLSTYLLIFL